MTQFKAMTLGVLISLTVSLAAQVSTNDLFDRPNNGNLGLDWLEVDGDAMIVGNQLQANSPFTFGWASHTEYNASYAATVVRARWSMNGGGGDRISVIAGADPNTFGGIEIRIADNNGDGTADRIFFNAAVNAGNWFGGSLFFNLAVPLVSGEVTLWFTNGGNTANVAIKNLTTLTSEVFSGSGILTFPPTGTSVGIGYFGNSTLDDFRAWVGVPTTPTCTLTPPRTGTSPILLVTDATPFGVVLLGSSVVGNGPFLTFLGPVGLTPPIDILATLFCDGTGRTTLSTAPLPPGAFGFVVHLQAADISALNLTNFFTTTIL